MKELISQKFGEGGQASLGLEGGSAVLSVKYPVGELAKPVTDAIDKMVDQIEAAIPGDWDKAVLEPIREAAKSEVIKLLSE